MAACVPLKPVARGLKPPVPALTGLGSFCCRFPGTSVPDYPVPPLRGCSVDMPSIHLIETPVSNIIEVPGDRGRCGHHWTHQVPASAATLAAFEIAVDGGRATLSGSQYAVAHPHSPPTS